MATTRLPNDFKEFLKLLNVHGVEYLLVGGHAVGYYGYPRPTGDIDFWVAMSADNAAKLVDVFREFGFDVPQLTPELFLKERSIVRVGVPPLRVEVLTRVTGLQFEECYGRRTQGVIDAIPVSILSIDDLRANKRAAGRHKDLADLENLP